MSKLKSHVAFTKSSCYVAMVSFDWHKRIKKLPHAAGINENYIFCVNQVKSFILPKIIWFHNQISQLKKLSIFYLWSVYFRQRSSQKKTAKTFLLPYKIAPRKYWANLNWARGATDNASDYGSEDCRFESCRARKFFFANGSKKLNLWSTSIFSSFLNEVAR